MTIFSDLCAFVIENKEAIGAKMLASASYDILKRTLDFQTLKQRIKRFFINDEDIEAYLKELCSKASVNPNDPEEAVAKTFTAATGQAYDEGLMTELKDWIRDNQSTIISTGTIEQRNKKGFNIGTQNAKKIVNVQGDYHVNKEKKLKKKKK